MYTNLKENDEEIYNLIIKEKKRQDENIDQSLKEENDYLNKINANLINNQNMNIDDIAKMKLLLENKEKDYIDTIENLKQKVQDTINNLTSQVKQSQEQTEEVYHEHQKLKAEKDENEKTLNEQLNETQNQINKIINEKRTLMEQLKQLQQENEFLKGDYDDKIKNLFYYEHEYKCLDDKYRNVNNKNAENESKIIVLNNTIEAKQNEIKEIQANIILSQETGKGKKIIISGNKGTGKTSTTHTILTNHTNKIYIDCSIFNTAYMLSAELHRIIFNDKELIMKGSNTLKLIRDVYLKLDI